MKTALQILIIIALLGLGVIQILFAKGILGSEKLLEVCPVSAISMENSKARIDADKCIGCRRCVIGVPRKSPLAAKTIVEPITSETAVVTEPLKPAPETQKQDTAKANPTPVKVTSKPKLKYTVNPDVCIGCTLCVSNCPQNAITMVNDKAVIDNSKCISCDICVSGNKTDFGGCPVQAISKK